MRRLPPQATAFGSQIREGLSELAESWLMKIEDIRRFTRDAVDLNRTMVGIIERLDKHRRGITGANS